MNAVFEAAGGLFVLLSCRQLLHDKQTRGVSLWHPAFFFLWGFWNLFFYPSVDAWSSYYAGLVIAAANSLWLGLILFYHRR